MMAETEVRRIGYVELLRRALVDQLCLIANVKH
jgi:hypothetical protein